MIRHTPATRRYRCAAALAPAPTADASTGASDRRRRASARRERGVGRGVGKMEPPEPEGDGHEPITEPWLSKRGATGVTAGVFVASTLVGGGLTALTLTSASRVSDREAAPAHSGTAADSAAPRGRAHHAARATPAAYAFAVRSATQALLLGTLLCGTVGAVAWYAFLRYMGANDIEQLGALLRQEHSGPQRLSRQLQAGRPGQWARSMGQQLNLRSDTAREEVSIADSTAAATDGRVARAARRWREWVRAVHDSRSMQWMRARMHSDRENGVGERSADDTEHSGVSNTSRSASSEMGAIDKASPR